MPKPSLSAHIPPSILNDSVVAETLGYPIVTISGRGEVRIENHKGVSEYESEAITVLAGKFNIRVTGVKLELKLMNTDALIITGEINAVTF